jgi:ribosome recycling factor
VRNARRDSRKDLDGLRKDGDISEDDLHRAEAELDKLTKRFEAEIDAALETKTTELLEG